jgi:hypothetical protein
MAVLALTSLAGCSTTQQEAARLQLNSARLRAAEVALHIARRDPDVEVERATLVRGAGGSAIVVKLRNLSTQPVSDLPIAAGVLTSRRGRRRIVLNAAAGLDYFSTHTPSIPAGGELTWVLTSDRRFPAGTRAFAEVGLPVPVALMSSHSLPSLVVSAVTRAGALQVTVSNRSSVPQYQLPVYAVVWWRGRPRAAGQVTIAHLGTGSTTTLRLSLVGQGAAGAVAVQAPPTIFG